MSTPGGRVRMGLVNLGPTVVHSSVTAAVPMNCRYMDGEVLRYARVSLASNVGGGMLYLQSISADHSSTPIGNK